MITEKQIPEPHMVPCATCDGEGELHYLVDYWCWNADDHSTHEWTEDCDHCCGNGEVEDDDYEGDETCAV